MSKYILNEDLFDLKKGDTFPDAFGSQHHHIFEDIYTRLGVISPVEEKEWPQVGDEYYSINARGEGMPQTFVNDAIDKWNKLFGNMFKTEDEAQAKIDQIMGKGV